MLYNVHVLYTRMFGIQTAQFLLTEKKKTKRNTDTNNKTLKKKSWQKCTDSTQKNSINNNYKNRKRNHFHSYDIYKRRIAPACSLFTFLFHRIDVQNICVCVWQNQIYMLIHIYERVNDARTKTFFVVGHFT